MSVKCLFEAIGKTVLSGAALYVAIWLMNQWDHLIHRHFGFSEVGFVILMAPLCIPLVTLIVWMFYDECNCRKENS